MAARKMTEQDYAGVPLLIEQGMSKIEIAQRYGMKLSSLVVQCSRRGISLSRHGRRLPVRNLRIGEAPLDLEFDVMAKLRETARMRGTDEVFLIKHLLRTIVYDNLTEAVLDEEHA